MDIDVSVTDGVTYGIDAVASDAERALEHLALTDAELSVVLTTDPFIHDLNRTWRAKDSPTDVLSFPQEQPVLGDIVISLDTAARQAEELGHSLAEEIRVLLVHGIAHLLGHDHHEPEDAKDMAALEAEIMAALGAEPSIALVERTGAAR